MSIFRTLYPRDTITVRLYPATETDPGTVVIGYGGTVVDDVYDDLVRDQARAAGVRLTEGGPVLPAVDDLVTRVQHLEQQLSGRPIALDELPVRGPGDPNPPVRSGQLVPVDTTAGAVTLTLEPGASGSRVGVRLDAGTAPLSLTGADTEQSVPALNLTKPGTVITLEGITGGWRPVSRYTPDGSVSWAEIADRPAVPVTYADLTGQVPAPAIPDTIARSSDVTDAVEALPLGELSARLDQVRDRVTVLEPPADGGVHAAQQSAATLAMPAGAINRVPTPVDLRTTSLVTKYAAETGHYYQLHRSGLWSISAVIQFRNSTVANKRLHIMQSGTATTPGMIIAASAGSAQTAGVALGGAAFTGRLDADTTIHSYAYSSGADTLIDSGASIVLAYLGPTPS